MSRLTVVLLSILALATCRAAGQAMPATAPAPAGPPPAPSVAADPSSPKGTLKLLSEATHQGDVATARSLLHADGPQEQKMVDVLVDRMQAHAAFRAAATKAFGEAAADQLAGQSSASLTAELQAIDQANQDIQGDRATVDLPGQQAELVRVDGKWMLSMSAASKGLDAAGVGKQLDMIRMVVGVERAVTDEIESGKLKSAAEVQDALRAGLGSAVLKSAASAATQGARQPSAATRSSEGATEP